MFVYVTKFRGQRCAEDYLISLFATIPSKSRETLVTPYTHQQSLRVGNHVLCKYDCKCTCCVNELYGR